MMEKETVFVYSEPACDRLLDLLGEILTTFGIEGVGAEDLFHIGVRCRPETYAHYSGWDDAPDYVQVPEELAYPRLDGKDRMDYVKSMIEKVVKKEIPAPEWMVWIEQNMECDSYGSAPSRFLYLLPKKKEYAFLGARLTDFLYSPLVNTVRFNPVVL